MDFIWGGHSIENVHFKQPEIILTVPAANFRRAAVPSTNIYCKRTVGEKDFKSLVKNQQKTCKAKLSKTAFRLCNNDNHVTLLHAVISCKRPII